MRAIITDTMKKQCGKLSYAQVRALHREGRTAEDIAEAADRALSTVRQVLARIAEWDRAREEIETRKAANAEKQE